MSDERLDEVLLLLRQLVAGQNRLPDPWLTVDQASSYLNVARATLYKWVYEGMVPYHKLPGSSLVRFRASELDEWVLRGRSGSSTAVNEVLRKLR
jgi:excisionase family DNA binding protein